MLLTTTAATVALEIAKKVADALFSRYSEGVFEKIDARRDFHSALADALTSLDRSGYPIRGIGAIDESFLLNETVKSELWDALMSPTRTSDEINYDTLVGALDQVWENQQSFDNETKEKQRESIEFLVDRLYDEFLWHSPLLAGKIKDKILQQLDSSLSLRKRRYVIGRYLDVSISQMRRIQDDLMGDNTTYIEPVLQKRRKNPASESELLSMVAPDRTVEVFAPEEQREYEDVEFDSYFTGGQDVRVAIVGDSGLGKTTLLQELFLRLCRNWKLGQPIAVFFTPDQAKNCGEKDVGDVLCARLGACETHVRDTQLRRLTSDLLEQGLVTFIVDALDQVDDPEPLTGYLKSISSRRHRFIISARPSAIMSHKNALRDFSYLRILPFDRDRIEAYYGDIVSSRRLSGLSDELLGIPMVAHLSRGLFASGAASQATVVNRSDLYHAIMRMVPKREEDYDALAGRDPGDVLDSLRMLAFETLKRNYLGQCPRDEAKGIIGRDEVNVLQRLQYLMKFIESGEDTLTFRHRSFQEYLAAEVLREAYKPSSPLHSSIGKFLFHPNWEEPLRFLAGLLDEEGLRSLVWDILHPEGNPVFLLYHEHLRLAAVSLHEARSVPPDLENDVIDRIVLLNNEDQIELLGTWGRGRAESTLLSFLLEDDVRCRWSAIGALGDIKSEAAVPALIEALKDPEKNVRASAASALAKVNSEAAVPALIEAMKVPGWLVGLTAADALEKVRSEAAVRVLIEALKDPEEFVRWTVANALGKLKSEAAVPVLIEALKDPKGLVRVSAAGALGEVKPEVALPVLIEALKNPEQDVRRAAANALGKAKSEAAVPALIEALKDPEENVRGAAIGALRDIKSEAAACTLIEALKDPEWLVRVSAAYAIRDIKPEAAVPALIEALKDQKRVVRGFAADALGNVWTHASIEDAVEAFSHEKDPSTKALLLAVVRSVDRTLRAAEPAETS